MNLHVRSVGMILYNVPFLVLDAVPDDRPRARDGDPRRLRRAGAANARLSSVQAGAPRRISVRFAEAAALLGMQRMCRRFWESKSGRGQAEML